MKRIIALMAMVAAGLALYLYPQANQWFQRREDFRASLKADQSVSLQTPKAQDAMLEAANAYNLALSREQFDVFDAEAASSDLEYQQQLRDPKTQLPDTGADGAGAAAGPVTLEAMAKIDIPKVDISLPIYHGTSEEALAQGAGHIYGTSLPVGGESTHTVITAHSRQGQAGRFTRIRELEEGDEFLITAAGRTIRYVVDQITVVLPSDIEDLQIIPGEDHATLLTCTPLGLNTHRLLVRGVRADLPTTAGKPLEPGKLPFPWWAVWFGVGVALSGLAGWGINRAMGPKAALAGAEGADDETASKVGNGAKTGATKSNPAVNAKPTSPKAKSASAQPKTSATKAKPQGARVAGSSRSASRAPANKTSAARDLKTGAPVRQTSPQRAVSTQAKPLTRVWMPGRVNSPSGAAKGVANSAPVAGSGVLATGVSRAVPKGPASTAGRGVVATGVSRAVPNGPAATAGHRIPAAPDSKNKVKGRHNAKAIGVSRGRHVAVKGQVQ